MAWKFIAAVFFIAFFVGAGFSAVLFNPSTHDFNLTQDSILVENNNILFSFQINSFQRSGLDFFERSKTFTIKIPLEVYNSCRASGQKISFCGELISNEVEFKAGNELFKEYKFLNQLLVRDFSNEITSETIVVNPLDAETVYNELRNPVIDPNEGS